MAIFRIEINVVDGDKDWKINEGEYVKKFYESAHKYSLHPFENNNDVINIEISNDKWDMIEKILPYKLYEIDEEIFIKDNMLCTTNTPDIDNVKQFLPDSCETKIIKKQDEICLEPINKYIDEFIIKFIKDRIGSVSTDDFEFYEPILKLYYRKGKLIELHGSKRLTNIYVKKNGSVIAMSLYADLQPWNYDVNGEQIYKPDKEKYRFRTDEIIRKGDTLTFSAKNIPEKIERDDISFNFNFEAIEKRTNFIRILAITEEMARNQNDGKIELFEKEVEVKVELFSLENGKSGDIIRIEFLKIDPSIEVKVMGYDNHSTEYINRYVYSSDLILWKYDK